MQHQFVIGLVFLGAALLILLQKHFSVFDKLNVSGISLNEDHRNALGSYTVCTYFVPIGVSESIDLENVEMLEVWKDSWQTQGWNTKVLNEDDAKLHPRYKQLKEAIPKLPTVFPEKLSSACYLRWAAAAASGCNVSTSREDSNWCAECFFTVDVRPRHGQLRPSSSGLLERI